MIIIEIEGGRSPIIIQNNILIGVINVFKIIPMNSFLLEGVVKSSIRIMCNLVWSIPSGMIKGFSFLKPSGFLGCYFGRMEASITALFIRILKSVSV